MKKFLTYLAVFQLLTQAELYAYENKADCISTLTSAQSDAELIEMICNSTNYESPKTKEEEEWEQVRERLQQEALPERKQKELESTLENIRNRQMEIRQEAQDEEAQREAEERQRRKRAKCSQYTGYIESESQRGVPRYWTEHELRSSNPDCNFF